MKKKFLILVIILLTNFIDCTVITLTNPVLKIVDGVKGLMDANNVHKILYIGQAINKFLNGEIDPQTKKRIPQHNFAGKLYTLNELVKIEEEFEKKYGPIYECIRSLTENPQTNGDSANIAQTSVMPDTISEENFSNHTWKEPANSSNKLTENQTKGRIILDTPPRSTLAQHLSKEVREQYEKEKKMLIEALNELKEKFLKETGPFLKDARGTKEQMFRLIQEWAEKANRPDSLLLGWSSEEEGASFKRHVTSIKKLHTFCLDLTDFLKVLVQSCPKALKAFIKENPNYKLAHAKP